MKNLGNILNFVFTLSLIIGIIIYYRKPGVSTKTIHIFLTFLIIALIIAYLSTLINFPKRNVLLFKQQADKVIDASLFTVYQFIMFAFISYVWLNILKIKHLAVLRSLVNGVLMIIFFLVFTFIFIKTDGHSARNFEIKKSKKNLGVVLGAAVWSDNKPSPSLAARVDKAIKLYREGYIGKILFTGSNAPGELSEAGVAYNYALSEGMLKDVINLENQTTSTAEQIGYIKRSLINQPGITEIVVISDAYHLARVLEISRFFNIKVKLAPADLTSNYKDIFYRELRESIALIVFWSFAI